MAKPENKKPNIIAVGSKINETLYAKLQSYCKLQDRTESYVIRQLLTDKFKK